MREKEEYLVQVRPEIPGLKKGRTYFNSVEEFQNACLRPIIKYQHDLIIKAFQKEKNLQTVLSRANNSREQTFAIIHQYVNQNKGLKFFFIGIIIGLLTILESEYYLTNYKEINKRISQMITERINHFIWH